MAVMPRGTFLHIHAICTRTSIHAYRYLRRNVSAKEVELGMVTPQPGLYADHSEPSPERVGAWGQAKYRTLICPQLTQNWIE